MPLTLLFLLFLFFFNHTATTEIYTLSLHDALPICADPVSMSDRPSSTRSQPQREPTPQLAPTGIVRRCLSPGTADRKSTRLNSSHSQISYAVFCLKKKKQNTIYQYNSANNY